MIVLLIIWVFFPFHQERPQNKYTLRHQRKTSAAWVTHFGLVGSFLFCCFWWFPITITLFDGQDLQNVLTLFSELANQPATHQFHLLRKLCCHAWYTLPYSRKRCKYSFISSSVWFFFFLLLILSFECSATMMLKYLLYRTALKTTELFMHKDSLVSAISIHWHSWRGTMHHVFSEVVIPV